MHPDSPYLKIAYDITRSHHERWDGNGFPDALKGDEIPLAARIMSVADVYDALTSKRVYKAAMPHLVACGIIRDGIGTQFDPKIVEAFELAHEEFEWVRQEINDEPTEQPNPLHIKNAA